MLCVGCAVQVKLRNEAGCLCCGKTVCCDMYESDEDDDSGEWWC